MKNFKKKILVIGGNSHIIQDFLKVIINKYDVTITYNKHLNLINKFKCNKIKFDLLKSNTKILPKKIDYLVISAATTDMKNKRIKEINYKSIEKITNYANEKSIKKIIYFSSILVNDYIEIKKKKRPFFYNYAKYKFLTEKYLISNTLDKTSVYNLRLPGILCANANKTFISKITNDLLFNKDIRIYNKDYKYNNLFTSSEISKLILNLLKINKKQNFTIPLATTYPLKLINILNLMKKELKSKSKIECLKSSNLSKNIKIKNMKKLFDYRNISTKKSILIYLKNIKKAL